MSEAGALDAHLVRALSTLSTATLHEAAGQTGALPSAIKPIARAMRVCGVAFTVASPPLDNLWLHRAIAAASTGSVLVVTVGGVFEAGYWGDIMTTAALARGLGGLVIDGCVRDLTAIAASGFPVFARGLCIRGTAKDPASAGRLQGALEIGSVLVRPGDLIVGDADGVVALASDTVSDVLARARRRVAGEADVVRALRQGRTTLDIYGWDRGGA